MLESGQFSTLTEMGIPVWEKRTLVSASVVSNVISTDVVEALPAVDCLIAFIEQDHSDDAMRLLHAMLFSVGLTVSNSAIVSPTQLTQLMTSTHEYKLLLVFGDDLIPASLNSQTIVRGHVYSAPDSTLKIMSSLSLKTLLHSPGQKAIAWQDLLMAKQCYQQNSS